MPSRVRAQSASMRKTFATLPVIVAGSLAVGRGETHRVATFEELVRKKAPPIRSRGGTHVHRELWAGNPARRRRGETSCHNLAVHAHTTQVAPRAYSPAGGHPAAVSASQHCLRHNCRARTRMVRQRSYRFPPMSAEFQAVVYHQCQSVALVPRA
jgi:hypothetical protein